MSLKRIFYALPPPPDLTPYELVEALLKSQTMNPIDIEKVKCLNGMEFLLLDDLDFAVYNFVDLISVEKVQLELLEITMASAG